MDTYNIAISASSEYIRYANVMILSFCKNHLDSLVNLYIFHTDKNIVKHKSVFLKLIKKFNKKNNVEFVHVDYEKVRFVDNKKGWPVDLWGRWYMFDYLADTCDRVLSLGIDTMLRGNLKDFYFQNLKGYYFACCPDMFINNSESIKWPNIKNDMERFNLKDKSKYINGDIVLVNLKETKNKLSFNKFLKTYNKHQFTCWDQDTITYCFNDKIKFQDYLSYNYFPNLNLDRIDDKIHSKNAKIIHFAGGPKPWRVPVCEAKNYNFIPEWVEYAKEVGIINWKIYLKCFLQLPFRGLKRTLKKIIKLFIKKISISQHG